MTSSIFKMSIPQTLGVHRSHGKSVRRTLASSPHQLIDHRYRQETAQPRCIVRKSPQAATCPRESCLQKSWGGELEWAMESPSTSGRSRPAAMKPAQERRPDPEWPLLSTTSQHANSVRPPWTAWPIRRRDERCHKDDRADAMVPQQLTTRTVFVLTHSLPVPSPL